MNTESLVRPYFVSSIIIPCVAKPAKLAPSLTISTSSPCSNIVSLLPVRTPRTIRLPRRLRSSQSDALRTFLMTMAAASAYDLPIHSMVSQPHLPPPPSDRALAARRPGSVTSRSNTTRRHRSSRSHHGSSSYRPQNEFPNFAQTGDVEIIINADGQERRYMLHRLILAQCSGFFETGTSEEWSRAQAQAPVHNGGSSGPLSRIGEEGEERQVGRPSIPGPSTGQSQMWRYELDWGNGDEDQPMLVQKVRTVFR